jgi:hypothetical protein
VEPDQGELEMVDRGVEPDQSELELVDRGVEPDQGEQDLSKNTKKNTTIGV